jgi:hypothetical protein
MAGLSRVKTYALKRLISHGALTAADANDMVFWMAKEAMLYGTDGLKGGTAAWTVVGSCNSASFNMAGTDLLVAPANIVQNTGNHSWIVLKQPLQGAAPGFLQVCFDWNTNDSTQCSVSFSIAAGYTGGAINARPTATDQVVVFSGNSVVSSAAATGSCGVNCIKSTDGKVTRMILSKDGTPETRAFWAFEELLDVESYWTSKTVVAVVGLTQANLTGASNLFNYQGGSHAGRMSWASTYSYQLSDANAGTMMHRPDYGGAWPVFPCGMFNDVGASKGKLGNFADLWAASYTVPTGEYFAGAGGGDFQYVNIKGLVFPWNGEPLVLP